MTMRQSFFAATRLSAIWNKVIVWNGYTLATVQWHNGREWKVLEPGTTFEMVRERAYKPLAQFHTQQELWQYIKSQNS